MIDLLFVSVAFPPKNDPECLQTAKYVSYLTQKEGIAVDAVTSAIPTLFMPKDEKLLYYGERVRQLIEIPLFENKYLNYIIRKIAPSFIEQPDSKYTFAKRIKRAIPKLKKKPDCIYSRSFPLSSTIAAYQLVEHYNVPWIMHLSDPWVDSPIHVYTSKAQKFHEAWEQKCFERASYISFTSHQAVNFYKNKYPQYSSKLLFFPNVYDPEDISTAAFDFKSKLRFVYTGGLSGDRTPLDLLKVLDKLYKEDASIADKVEFIFAGQFDRRSLAYFEEYPLPFVQNLGLLPFPEAVKLQRTADVLVVIDTPFKREEETLFFPSKLLDYIAAKRRVFAITNPNGPTTDVLGDKNGDWCIHGDLESIEKNIQDAILNFEKKNESYFCNEEVDEIYSAKYNTERLINYIKNLV